jgi:hypothetical protein
MDCGGPLVWKSVSQKDYGADSESTEENGLCPDIAPWACNSALVEEEVNKESRKAGNWEFG